MAALMRTVVGLVLGGLSAKLLALLARLHVGPSNIHQAKTRRTFLRNAALGASGAFGALLSGGFIWFWWPNKTGAFGSEIPVSADSVPDVKGTPLRNVQGKFWLVHNDDGLMALYTVCPHLGCSVPWVGPADSPQAFQCPCHGSMYDYNGVRTGGPAPRPMDYMGISVQDNGSLMVDTGNIQQRSDYDPSQATPYTA